MNGWVGERYLAANTCFDFHEIITTRAARAHILPFVTDHSDEESGRTLEDMIHLSTWGIIWGFWFEEDSFEPFPFLYRKETNINWHSYYRKKGKSSCLGKTK